MDKIEIKVLNPSVVTESEKMMVAMARLTQRGETITSVEDLQELLDKKYSDRLVHSMAALPHPTIQKFGVINVAVVGASRRFLAQITRHQNEVKFMSGSLQYSDYSGAAQFVVPYEITTLDADNPIETGYGPSPDYRRAEYLKSCRDAYNNYEAAIRAGGIGRDAAGYMMPQGMRNVLIISATPYQLKHMISQRICRRNTLETMYVMLRIWEELWSLSDIFHVGMGPSCMVASRCNEGKMSCGNELWNKEVDEYFVSSIVNPDEPEPNWATCLLDINFPLIRGVQNV